ncbi:ArsR/SmtB family transcription factor [Embleya hyalina]|uniref:Transcriptional regulator n=1 Tax=Embleya hyalina TaxID=516124 RepID=A0A401YMM4_9ACTN|nr:metalloregulator ArsR/SmtB family transcription factor [Embleya hyalina]GCD95862.1 transcriptional regulator [Embleya hyalina]
MTDTPAADDACRPLDARTLQQAAATFGMLAATNRLQIMWLLSQGESDVGTIADKVGGTVATVSQHLAKLKQAGMVGSRREGRRRIYVLDDPHIAILVDQVVAHQREQDLRGGTFTDRLPGGKRA